MVNIKPEVLTPVIHSKFLVYGLFDPRNDQLRYIGESSNGLEVAKRHRMPCEWKSLKTHKQKWIYSLVKLGWDPIICVLKFCNSREEALEEEIRLIDYYRKQGFRLTNIADGWQGSKGHKQSAETKEKRAEKLRGQKRSPETLERMRIAQTGKKMSVSARKKMSDRLLGTKQTPEFIEKRTRSLVGRKQSEETIAKRVKTRKENKGYSPSEETKQKISNSLKGHEVPPEVTRKAVETRRRKKLEDPSYGKRKAPITDAYRETLSKAQTLRWERVRLSKKKDGV